MSKTLQDLLDANMYLLSIVKKKHDALEAANAYLNSNFMGRDAKTNRRTSLKGVQKKINKALALTPKKGEE